MSLFHYNYTVIGSQTLDLNKVVNTEFIFSTEGQCTGGFAKWPDTHPGIASNFNMYNTCMYNVQYMLCGGLLIFFSVPTCKILILGLSNKMLSPFLRSSPLLSGSVWSVISRLSQFATDSSCSEHHAKSNQLAWNTACKRTE